MRLFTNQFKFCVFFFLTIVMLPVYAWDSTGHRLIATIAYDHLTPASKIKINQLTKILDGKYPSFKRFLYASILPDVLRANKVATYNSWHYIDYPFSTDGTPVKQVQQENVVWAIDRSKNILKNPSSSESDKAQALSFLIHFAGDAHQPLHCVTRLSKDDPKGDQGGNLFPIINANDKNLHQFWDEGAGYFREHGARYPLSIKNISKLAKQIEIQYPQNYFGNKVDDLNPADWAMQSFDLAKKYVYQIPPNTAPTSSYIKQSQQIVLRQIALSGYRLANLLNALFS